MLILRWKKFFTKSCLKNFSEQSFLQDLKQGLVSTANFSDFNSPWEYKATSQQDS